MGTSKKCKKDPASYPAIVLFPPVLYKTHTTMAARVRGEREGEREREKREREREGGREERGKYTN